MQQTFVAEQLTFPPPAFLEQHPLKGVVTVREQAPPALMQLWPSASLAHARFAVTVMITGVDHATTAAFLKKARRLDSSASVAIDSGGIKSVVTPVLF